MLVDRVFRIPPARTLTGAFLRIVGLQECLSRYTPSLTGFSHNVSKAQRLNDEMELLRLAVHGCVDTARRPLCVYDTSYVDNYASTIDLQDSQFLLRAVRPPTAPINWPFAGNELSSVHLVRELVWRAARVT